MTFTSLPGPAEVEAAVLGADGILAGAHPADTFVDVSTTTPATIRKIAAAATDRQVSVLDAPVSGSVRGARNATLVFMVGGDRGAFDHCEPILRSLGQKVFYTGDVGTGTIAKLVNNYMGLSNAVASMEAVVMGTRAGVDPRTLLQVVEASSGASYMTSNLYPYLVFKRNFEPAKFALRLAAKDFRQAVELAHELGLPIKVGEAVAESLADGVRAGLADQDFSAYITLLEQAVGIEVRA